MIKFFKILYYKLLKQQTRKLKIIVYTANSGAYDSLRTHSYLSKQFDYICYTDTKVKGLHGWEIRPMKEFDNKDSVRKARLYKILPHKLFPEYDYSIWVDANWDVIGNSLEKKVLELIKKDSVLAFCPHPDRNCVYDECQAVVDLNKDSRKIVDKQKKFLKEENYPRSNGLYASGFIFRKHNDRKIKAIMEDWWEQIQKFSRRDQLSLNYVLWKNNFNNVDLLFPKNNTPLDGNKDFKKFNHNYKSKIYNCD